MPLFPSRNFEALAEVSGAELADGDAEVAGAGIAGTGRGGRCRSSDSDESKYRKSGILCGDGDQKLK